MADGRTGEWAGQLNRGVPEAISVAFGRNKLHFFPLLAYKQQACCSVY